jgi:glycosyltransferase involved in cell wall biosynthesis
MACVEAQAAGLPVLASDAVPRECVVVPELVHFEKVAAGEEVWASKLLHLAKDPHTNLEANRRVAGSAFSIESSALALMQLYTTGTLPN